MSEYALSAVAAMPQTQRDKSFMKVISSTIVTTNSTTLVAAPGALNSVYIWGWQYSCSGAYSVGNLKDEDNTLLASVGAGLHATEHSGAGQCTAMLPMPLRVTANKLVKIVGNTGTGWNETSHVFTLFYTIQPAPVS